MILAISVAGDLHALAIEREFEKRGRDDFHIIECDKISESAPIDWYITEGKQHAYLTDRNGKTVDVSAAEILWWRRVRAPQTSVKEVENQDYQRLVNNDCRGVLSGALQSSFRGKWISDQFATDRASDKLVQLTTARAAGFKIPKTLISQNVGKVKEFISAVGGTAIVKPVVGAIGPLIFTQPITVDDLPSDADISFCPTQYQEMIRGSRHIRLNCFGETIYSFIVESKDLDWRQNLNVPVYEYPTPKELEDKVILALNMIGLEMGIFDFKIDEDGEIFWFEVNPQGQFLFLEGLTKVPLASHFADYLIAQLH